MPAAASHSADQYAHRHWWQRVAEQYAGDQDRPLGSYLGVMAGYSAVVGGVALLARGLGRRSVPGGLDIVLSGELVSCPFCLGQWVATGFPAGQLFAPTLTRVAAAVFTELAIADFLHFGYSLAEEKQQQAG